MTNIENVISLLNQKRDSLKLIAFKYGLLKEAEKFIEEAHEFEDELARVSSNFEVFKLQPHEFKDFIGELADCIVSLFVVISACEQINSIKIDTRTAFTGDFMWLLTCEIDNKISRTITRSIEGYYDEAEGGR